MNELQVFKNVELGSVRTTVVDGIPYFVGKDVAEILGYRDTSDALKRHVDEDDKLTRCFTDSGQNREMYVINESGLYSLILRSQLPKACQFKRWVTSQVLPSIRKHGMYATEELINNPDMAIAVFNALKEERAKREALELTTAMQKQQIAELKPKASYYDVVLKCKDIISMRVIAKDYGKSAQWMNNFLHELGVQYKQSDTWLLYQKYADQEYTKSRTNTYEDSNGVTHSKMHTYWTQKGRLFIYHLMTQHGIYPLIEQEAKDE